MWFIDPLKKKRGARVSKRLRKPLGYAGGWVGEGGGGIIITLGGGHRGGSGVHINIKKNSGGKGMYGRCVTFF